MVSLLLLAFLLFGLLMGLKRGFILQVFHLVGYIIAFLIAANFYDKLSPKLSLWIPYPELSGDQTWAVFLDTLPLQNGFYNAISFAVIFFATKIVLQIIATMLDFVASIPFVRPINRLLGATLGFVEVYLILFIILFILALTPIDSVQAAIEQSRIAVLIIEKTPFLSSRLEGLWLASIGQLI